MERGSCIRTRVPISKTQRTGELLPRVGFIVTNLTLPSRAVVPWR